MRKTTRALLVLTMFIGSLVMPVAAAGGSMAAAVDIKDQLLAIPGLSLIEEKPVSTPGYRFFLLNFTQPVDHRHPRGATFQQRISVLHKDVSRPTVMFTSGYGLNVNPARSEPTRIVDGNQVSMEYRFFTPSRPQPADWSDLNIWQAATDEHRIYRALKPIFNENWLATGGSKGGMTATYYERFYPHDMDGTVATWPRTTWSTRTTPPTTASSPPSGLRTAGSPLRHFSARPWSGAARCGRSSTPT